MSEKDREFIEAYHAARPLNHNLIVGVSRRPRLSRRSKSRPLPSSDGSRQVLVTNRRQTGPQANLDPPTSEFIEDMPA
jgi:hypothetical protein